MKPPLVMSAILRFQEAREVITFVIISVVLGGCVSSTQIISTDQLNAYSYAVVVLMSEVRYELSEDRLNAYSYAVDVNPEYEGFPSDQFGLRRRLRDMLRDEGLRVFKQNDALQLNEEDKSKLLVAGIDYNLESDGRGGTFGTVTITMWDALTNQSIYSSTRVQRLASNEFRPNDRTGDLEILKGALKNAFSVFKASYGPSAE